MKCPKCSYLGFETGNRCKNCGYDFSLLLGNSEGDSTGAPLGVAVESAGAGAAVGVAPPGDTRAAARLAPSSLPLFQPGPDDEPLIKLPVAPRPPLAVRRTPERPRARQVPKAVRVAEPLPSAMVPSELPLRLLDELSLDPPSHRDVESVDRLEAPSIPTSGGARRLAAAVIDHSILLAVDAIVIYFTLKVAALGAADWRALPAIPLLAFAAMLKIAYFCAFTLVGGQTIGKMALGLRVVGEDGGRLDPAQALQRTLTGALSFLALGLGFLPALIADDRRGIHDRVARTRVIALPSK